jgi:hypothetical protein
VTGTRPRCDGCAFTAGTEANLSQLTRIKSLLCAKLADPFYCHANLVDGVLPEGQERLCSGWAEAVSALLAKGHYEQQSPFQRDVLGALLQIVITLEDRIEAGDDLESFDVPTEVLAILGMDSS